MRVIGYAFHADTHCVECTKALAANGTLACTGHGYYANEPGEDEHGLPYALADQEKNSVHPIFSTDEGPMDEDGNEMPMTCGTCHEIIKGRLA